MDLTRTAQTQKILGLPVGRKSRDAQTKAERKQFIKAFGGKSHFMPIGRGLLLSDGAEDGQCHRGIEEGKEPG